MNEQTISYSTAETKQYCRTAAYGTTFTWYVPNGACLWRYQTLRQKEPWTLEWIDSFQPSDVFWDVGANIGIYSVYAAVRKKIKVFAFEPEAANYRVLNENIRINNIENNVDAYCIAISDNISFGKLALSKIETAASGHQFRKTRTPAFRQGCVSYTLDSLYDHIGPPTHIKIDVDGIEPLVLKGGLEKVLSTVKSVMIETCDLDEKRFSIKQTLIDQGFTWDQAVAERSVHKEGQYKGVGEHLFTR